MFDIELYQKIIEIWNHHREMIKIGRAIKIDLFLCCFCNYFSLLGNYNLIYNNSNIIK